MNLEKASPNILMICSDQHASRYTGCYENDIVDTPSLDRLSREGIVFDSTYCNCPLCVPSRMSFLTGLQPFQTEDCLGNDGVLSSIIPTYGHCAAGAGYHTVLAGRMHFKGPDQHHGFIERPIGDLEQYAFGSSQPDYSPLKGQLGNMSAPDPLSCVGPGNTYHIDYDRAVAETCCRWLENFAQAPEKIPFLMTVGFMAPHCPFICPAELYEKYSDRVPFELPSAAEVALLHPYHKDYRKLTRMDEFSANQQHKAAIAYYGLVDFLDQCIGGIIDALEKNRLLENTIIVYFSDHGEMLGKHGRWHKGCFYEDSIKVPLIVRMPGAEHAGQRIDALTSLIDIFPTIAGWTGGAVPELCHGRDLSTLFSADTTDWDNIVRAEYYDCGCMRMVRRDEWKYCFYSNYEKGELYNLKEDPGEMIDRIDDRSCVKLAKELHELAFSDGWNTEVLDRRDERWRKYGVFDVINVYDKAFSKNPFFIGDPYCWAGKSSCRNFLMQT